MEYYTVKPPESSKVDEALRDFLDGALDPLLGTNQGSLPIKFLYKYFGPGSAANEINKVITREDGFYFLDGLQIIADSGPKAEIAAALTLALRGVALGILGGASLPIALEVAVAGAAAAGATWVYQAFVQPAVGRILEIFGVASTRLEITDSSGQSVAGVVYRNGLAAEGKSSIDAALSLVNFSDGKFNVNSHVAVYINDNESTGYDVLAGNHLAQIAGAMGVTTTVIANGSGLGADGTTAKNSDLLTPYLSGADFTIMQTGAKLGLHMHDKDAGEDVQFLKKETSVGGDLSGLNLQASKIAVFGSNGVDNLDLGGATGKIYAYGGMGADNIRGGRGDDVLWGDSPGSPSNGEVDIIHGGAGNDQMFGGGGGDQLFGDGGDDYIEGGDGDDTIEGGDEIDEIWGGKGNDTVHGGEGADIIRGGSSVPGESDSGNTDGLYGDGGNDQIYGAEGDDKLYGGVDNDKVFGNAGNDKLFGGTGKDRLTGGAGADEFYLGLGDIVLDSDPTDKLFIGNDASDEEASYDQVKYLEQGDGIGHTLREWTDLEGNYLEGYNHFFFAQGDGNFINVGNTLIILQGDSYIIARDYQFGDFGLEIFDPAAFMAEASKKYDDVRLNHPDEHFYLAPYLDSLRSALAAAALADAAEPSDRLRGLETPTRIEIAGSQNIDFLQGTAADDEIIGGGEMDLLLGGAGSDVYRYLAGDGDDYIMDYDGDADDTDVLTFDDLNAGDIKLRGGGNDLYIDVLGTELSTITIINQFAEEGLEGVEEIRFADGTVWDRAHIFEALLAVRGTDGDDELYAKAQEIDGVWQPTIFFGGRGDDHLYGVSGRDTYVYAKGDGNDTIEDFEDDIGTLRLSDLIPDDVTISRMADSSLAIRIVPTGETITAKISSNQDAIDRIEFADGTVWDRDAIIAHLTEPVIRGTDGDDALLVPSDGYTVDPGRGEDVIRVSGDGSNTIIFAKGDGHDVFDYSDGDYRRDDKLVLTDILPSEIEFSRDGDLLVIKVQSTGDSFTVDGQFRDASYGVNAIQFADGTTWNRGDIDAHITELRGSDGNDTLSPPANGATVAPGRGDDYIFAHGVGANTIVFAKGDGHDVVANGPGQRDDTLNFTDILPADVELNRDGDRLIITVPSTGDSFTVNYQFYQGGTDLGINRIKFADGTSWDRAAIDAHAWFRGTAGNDTLVGTSLADTFDAREGDDALKGGTGSDTYQFGVGYGNDTITEISNAIDVDTIKLTGLSVVDVSFSRSGNDLYLSIASTGERLKIQGQFNGAGIERIVFADSTVWGPAEIASSVAIVGSNGADTINGTSANDIIRGGGGNDLINGLGGTDTYLYARGDGNDTITETESFDSGIDKVVLEGINPASVSLSRNGNDATLVIAESAPGAGDGGSILLKNELDESYGRGVEQVVFADGTIWTRADLRLQLLAQASTSGNDTITGFNVADTIRGGAGNDALSGAGGTDTYLYARGDSNDTITEVESFDSGIDQVVLEGINPASVSVSRNGNDATLVIAESAPGEGDGGSILLKNELDESNGRGIEQIVFADGTIWTRADLRLRLLAQASTSGNDTITGFNVADTIRGGAGNDALSGAGGTDTYLYARGDSNDTITEVESFDSGIDQVVLEGINPASVSVSRNGNDATLVIAESAPGEGDGGSILLKNELDDSNGRGIEQIVFADGTIWTRADLRLRLLAQASTSGNDTIVGFNVADTIRGAAGDDALGGAGGTDIYLYARGDGNDTITEAESYDSGIDKVVLEGINPASVSLSRNGNDATLVIAESAPGADDGGSILLKNELDESNGRGIEQVVFTDGTIWTRADLRLRLLAQASTSGDDLITGFNTNDVITGGLGNDRLSGLAGNDTYVYSRGDGNDIIDDLGSSGTNKLVLQGIAPSEVTVVRNGGNVILLIGNGGVDGRITVRGQSSSTAKLSSVQFDDGMVWTDQTIASKAIANDGTVLTHLGTSGADTIDGTSDVDVIDGGAGDDLLRGAGGSDVYRWGAGSGNDTIVESGSTSDVDTIRLIGLNATDVAFGRLGSQLSITILATGEVLKVQNHFNDTAAGIEQIRFADNTMWDRSQILSAAWIRGTSADDTLSGTSGNDVFFGGLGNDRFNSGTGSDTYVYARGDGNDYIDDNSASTAEIDTLRLTDLNASDLTFSRVGVNLIATINSNGQTITVDEQFYSQTSNYGIEKIEFANGTNWNLATINANAWYRGTSGDDTISGSSWNDTFKGGLGNDRFNSGTGSDTYVYARGDGNDYIDDNSGSTAETDTLRLTDLNASDLTFSRVGVNLVATINSNGQTITIDEQFYSQTSNYGIEKIEFADGTSWSLAQINASAWIRGTSGNDTIAGTSWNDTFQGSLGDDRFNSGTGSDTYVYALGDGNDYINDESGSTTEVDVLRLIDLNASDLTFSRFGANLVATVNLNGQTITFDEQFYSQTANWGLEKINFANGASWDLATINANAWIRGTSGNDALSGTAWNDTLFGNAGNDTLTGGAGSDKFIFGAGFGQDKITDFTAGTDKIEFHDGLFADASAALAAAMQSGNNTVITIDAETSILLQNVAVANLHVDDFRVV